MYPAKFVHREAWGALEPKDENFLPHPIEGFVLTFTDTPRCLNKRQCYETVQAIQLRDMNRGYHDIRYNYLIGGDGYSYEGRGWCVLPPKPKLYPYLHGRVAIFAFIGPRDDDFDPKKIEVRPIKGVSRHEWGAAPVQGFPTPMQLPLNFVTAQYTGSKPRDTKEKAARACRKLQRQHMLRGYRDIKYSFLINSDGHIFEGRGWNVLPEKHKHYKKIHGQSIYVGFLWRHPDHISSKMPDLSKVHVVLRDTIKQQYLAPQPPPEMFHAFLDLIRHGVKNNYINPDYSYFISQ